MCRVGRTPNVCVRRVHTQLGSTVGAQSRWHGNAIQNLHELAVRPLVEVARNEFVNVGIVYIRILT